MLSLTSCESHRMQGNERELQATAVLSDEQCPVPATDNATMRMGLLHWRAVPSVGHGHWEGS